MRSAVALLVLLLSVALAPGAAAGPASRPPNILFILADDMGWNAPSCYGNKDVATPHFDRLAAQGMRFTQAYAEPQCSPTRAAFLSGQYGARTGVFRVTHEIQAPYTYLRPPEAITTLPPSVATLARTLRAAGYATGLSGKWHITPDYPAAPQRSRDGGQYFDRYGFDFCGAADEATQPEDKAVGAITDDMIGFIERNRDRPWFAYVAHFSPHTRLVAPKALIEKHAARGYQRTTAPNGRVGERPTADYLAMLEHLDTHVGRLIDRVDALQLGDRTVVIFTSDNGGLQSVTNNAPLRAGKGAPYEGGIRVPLMVRWPGQIKPGSTCAEPVHPIDYYPTFVELAAATAPAGHILDGESLVPLWRQTGRLPRESLYWHIPTYTTGYGRAPCAVIRQGEWKLIHYFGDTIDVSASLPGDRPPGKLVLGARTELFHLREDPAETADLAARRPDQAAALKRALETWWQCTGAKFPERNPEYDPANWWARDRTDAAPKKNRK